MRHKNHAQHYTPAKPIPMGARRPDWYDYFAAAVLVALLIVCALAYFDVLTK